MVSTGDDPLLCVETKTRVSTYNGWLRNPNPQAVASFIEARFMERYLMSMQQTKRGGSGFAVVGLACLTIEALEAFREGVSPHKMNGGDALQAFFSRRPDERVTPKQAFCGEKGRRYNCSCFYHGLRCGILHSGETTGGLRISSRPKEPLFDPVASIVNAGKLRGAVIGDVRAYARALAAADWQAEIWKSFRYRMRWTIKHCEPKAIGGESSPEFVVPEGVRE